MTGEDLDSEGEVFGMSGNFLEPEGGVVESAALFSRGDEPPLPPVAEGGRRGTLG